MSMKPELEIFRELFEDIFEKREAQMLRHVEQKIEGYRQSMWTRDRWCCDDMEKFAAKVWGVSQPKSNPDAFGQCAYQLRGYSVNYCPFCGVKV